MLQTCGIDEAGRGPIAGPVTAAAVIFRRGSGPAGLCDSKQLSPERRVQIETAIRATCLFGIGWAWPYEIDRLNIHHATLLAMQRAYGALMRRPDAPLVADRLIAFVDGRFCPDLPVTAQAVVGGDREVAEIQAASILAKTARDRFMTAYAGLDPRYGFERHKGYPTAAHLEAVRRAGCCGLHRRSFKGVRDVTSRDP